MRLTKSKKLLFASAAFIFLVMLFCNFYTTKLADDFNYHFSWVDNERIESMGQIFPSLAAHAQRTNGRVVAHFFVHLFEMLPKAIFNVINSGLFVALIFVIGYIASPKKINNFLFLGIFGAIWIFTPAFGQVFLWLDGACNYLWAMLFGLIYLIPFINDFLSDKPIKSLWMKIAVVIFALPVGAFSENGSSAVILIAVLLQLCMKFYQHKKFTVWGILSVVSACIGYLLMVSAPGTAKNKGVSLSLAAIRENLISSLEIYKLLEFLVIAFCIMLIIAIVTKMKREKLILAILFMIGSLCANFIMVAAAYYPERSAVFPAILLIVADAILFSHLFDCEYKILAPCVLSVLMIYTVFYMCIGINDIFLTGSQYKANEEYIVECREKDIMYVKVPMVLPQTKYSAGHGLMYLSTQDCYGWPNNSMAKYFEVDYIIGTWD